MALKGDSLEYGGIKPEDVERVASIASNQRQIAFMLGLKPLKWHRLKKDYPELESAAIRGLGKHIMDVNLALLDKAKLGDVRAAMYLDQKQMMAQADEEIEERSGKGTHEITGMGGFLLEGLEK